MKRVSLANLVPGMITAEDVFTYNNQLIVAKGTLLTDKIITGLEFYSIVSVRIAEPKDTDSVLHAQGSAVTGEKAEYSSYLKQVQASPEFKEFKADFETSIDNLKNNINDIVTKGAPIDVNESLKQTQQLIEKGKTNFSFFSMLHNMRQYDDQTYAHMMNVSLICRVLAEWLHFSEADIEMATLCGLFHDIGKLAIPDRIIKKPDKLTDEEYRIVKTHTKAGYDILQKQNINDHIKMAALMHHERCDGSGYPLGLSSKRIDKFAKLVAIADVYEAMTAARIYRGPLCPFTVIGIFEKEGLERYETEYILCFLENVVLTYMNNRVRLSDGREGDIIFINKNSLSKPMIKSGETFIDLSKEKNLSIVNLL